MFMLYYVFADPINMKILWTTAKKMNIMLLSWSNALLEWQTDIELTI